MNPVVSYLFAFLAGYHALGFIFLKRRIFAHMLGLNAFFLLAVTSIPNSFVLLPASPVAFADRMRFAVLGVEFFTLGLIRIHMDLNRVERKWLICVRGVSNLILLQAVMAGTGLALEWSHHIHISGTLQWACAVFFIALAIKAFHLSKQTVAAVLSAALPLLFLVLDLQTRTGGLPGMRPVVQAFFTMACALSSLCLSLFTHKRDADEHRRGLAKHQKMIAGLNQHIDDYRAIMEERARDIKVLMQSIEEGMVMIGPGQKILKEYSQYSQIVIGVRGLVNKNFVNTMFGDGSLNPGQRAALSSVLDRMINSDRSVFDQHKNDLPKEIIRKRKDGRHRFLQFDWSPVVNECLVVEKLIVVFRDITKLKEIQEQEKIRKLNTVLEQRVKERTQRLAVAASLTERLNSILSFDEVVAEVVSQIKKEFNYYHIHIYLMNDDGKQLIIAEGTGSAGAHMKHSRHCIALDDPTNPIAEAARTSRIVKVDNVRLLPDWSPNPLLPDTYAELAVPIRHGAKGRVMGVLDVQENRINALDEADTNLLRSLANHVAVALTNARLFEQTVAAKEEAEKANQAKSEFLANMSHELRTPLNGILGYAQILKMDNRLNHKQKDALNIVQQGGEHLLTLINDILDLTKIEAGKMELEPTDFLLPDLLQHIAGIARIQAKKKGLCFAYESRTELPQMVRADERRLRQVLINLLGNAVKFTHKGNVILRVDQARGRTNSTTGSNQRIRFEVQDTGIGIDPWQSEKIFLPFEQLKTGKLTGEGTGLGLNICRKLVRMMGAEIKMKSQVGQGSTFWFEIPLPPSQGDIRSSPVETRRIVGYKGRRLKVMIADDTSTNRRVLTELFTRVGFECIEAENGQDAVQKAITFKPNVIIMDLVMPRMTGIKATQELRRIDALQDILIIASSASVFDKHRQQSMLAGCDAFLPKPIAVGELYRILETHMNLEWIYDEKSSRPTEPSAKPATVKIVVPPPEELRVFQDLAMMGDLTGIEQRTKHIEQRDKRLVAFARQLRELAKGFEERKIIDLINQYME